MSCPGVHFAITAAEAEKLKSFEDDSDRLDYLQNEIEERYFAEAEEYLAQSDKAWDAMHRALGDGTLSYTDHRIKLLLSIRALRQHHPRSSETSQDN